MTYRIGWQRRKNNKRQVYGELDVTTCPLAAHVSTTGDDAADGSDARHLATVGEALEHVPDRVEHTRDILLHSGDTDAENTHGDYSTAIAVSRRVAPGGELRIVGVGDAAVSTTEYGEINSIEVQSSGRVRIHWAEPEV